MHYEYGGYWLPTRTLWLRAISQGWLMADGMYSKDEIMEFLNLPPEQLASEYWDGWFQDSENEEGVTIDELTKTFAELANHQDWLEDA